nr:tetratricopeptide repeat protein [Desulfobulbaceae bacterium]
MKIKIVILSLPLTLLLLILPVISSAAQESVKDLAAQGNEAFASQDYDKAYDLYGKALELEPGKAALYYNQANVLYRQQKYEEALGLYEKAIKNDPPRKLLSNIYFNSGNTALQMAELQTAEKQEVAELKKALVYYEKSFELYRNSLDHARATSIAEGRDVQEAGLYARQNWALARESWTATWDKIREIERKNLKLEDGVAGLLQAQLGFLPNLERTYLNSISDDILAFNLKRLAEYQLDYHADMIALNGLAEEEEQKLQVELDNLKANQTASVNPATGQPAPAQDTAEIEQQIGTASEIKKAVQQTVALGEWIVDSLKRGEPLKGWQSTRQMIDLLQSLTSFLEKSDPALEAYGNLVVELAETEELLSQASTLLKMDDSEGAKAAGQKRRGLALAKTAAAIGTINTIDLLLDQLKSSQQADADGDPSHPDPAGKQDSDGEETQAATSLTSEVDLLGVAAKQIIPIVIDELLAKNNKIREDLTAKSSRISEETVDSIGEQIAQSGTALIWYQHLSLSTSQIIATIVKDIEAIADQLQAGLDRTNSNSDQHQNPQLEGAINEEQIAVLQFHLQKTQEIVAAQLKESDGQATNEQGKQLIAQLKKGLAEVNMAWLSFNNSREKNATTKDMQEMLSASSELRLALMSTLLIFSPDTAIALYYERTRGLYKGLEELLPAQVDTVSALTKKNSIVTKEASGLSSLLQQYFAALDESIAKLDSPEKKEAYSSSLPVRRQSVELLKRFVDAGQDGTQLLKEKKFQQAELLCKDMSNSIDKSRMAFLEQPTESQELLSLAIEQQKKLEEQSRLANEAAATEGNPARIIRYVAGNQEDIKKITGKGTAAIEQQIGLAEVPTHGQDDQAQGAPNQQVDTSKLKEAIGKVADAQSEMGKIETFLKAAEFHNTLTKHQEVIKLLQEALDLLKNKPEEQDKEKGEDEQDDKQEGDQQDKDGQQGQPGEQGQNDKQGSSQPKKPLELGAQEARELLQQLNQQDENQQGEKVEGRGKRAFNTPRPW